MDLELKNLGQTLAVGGFAVYATLLLVRICRAKWVPRFFYAKDGDLQLQHTAVYLALVFAAGIILEDVSKNYSSRRAIFMSSMLERVLDSDNELRLRSLFKVFVFTTDTIEIEPRSIFHELQKLPPPHDAVAPHFKVINALIPPLVTTHARIDTPTKVKEFRSAVDGVYYDAKNVVFRNENYFKELSDIATRIDFTRSLTFLCLIFSLVYCVFSIFGFIPAIAKFLDIDEKERVTLPILTLLYIIGIWLAGSAYRSEATSFDNRVFGYYISLGFADEAKPPPQEIPPRAASKALPAPIPNPPSITPKHNVTDEPGR